MNILRIIIFSHIYAFIFFYLNFNYRPFFKKFTSVGTKELEELRSQISALKDGLKKAKEDLEGARKNREKLVKAKEASQEEVDRLETQVIIKKKKNLSFV